MTDQTPPFRSVPEDCVSKIISLTSPKDACRAAAVSTAFKSAAESDAVWNRFLPPDHGEILAAPDFPVAFSTKKELYLLLCDSHLLLAGGKMTLKLNRSNGKKTYMLSARELEIAGADNPVHWGWKSLPESRFAEVAELLNVCLLDICATIRSQILTPNTNYVASLVFKLSDDHRGLQDYVETSVTYGCPAQTEGETTYTAYYSKTLMMYLGLKVRGRMSRLARLKMGTRKGNVRAAVGRGDGWLEVKLGEFFVEEGDECDIRFQLCETELYRKKGLIVEGIEVTPHELRWSWK